MTNQNTACIDCKHDAHDPGRCKSCNCGEGDISHSDATSADLEKVVTWENFNRGEVSTNTVARIKPRKTGNE